MYSHAFYTAVRVPAPFVAGLNISTPDGINLAVTQVANGVLSLYDGDKFGNTVSGSFPKGPYYWGTSGTFPEPSFWGESGMAWDALVNYWYLTGDGSHNAAVQAALQAALDGQSEDQYLRNDDQMAWGLAAMTAAERGFPLAENEMAWEQRASTVFDTMAARWDTSTCGGGLREKYDYKHSASQAFFFQLAARLARFTGNQTYIDWASRSYDWMRSTELIDPNTFVWEGTHTTENCKYVDTGRSSFRDASFAYGSAILANITSNTTWSDRTSSHVSRILHTFFRHDIIREQGCTAQTDCTSSQYFFPAPTLRWLALLPVFQPATVDAIAPALAASAVAAAERCSTVYGDAGAFAQCTDGWVDDILSDYETDDEDTDEDVERTTCLGQQLAALDVLLASYVVGRDGGVNASVVLRTSSPGSGRGSESSATAAAAVALRLQEA